MSSGEAGGGKTETMLLTAKQGRGRKEEEERAWVRLMLSIRCIV
jgi:hypothetical protein